MLYCVFVLMTTVPTGKIGSEWTHFHSSLKTKISKCSDVLKKKAKQKNLTNKKAPDLCKEIGIIHFGARTYEIQLYWTLESPNVSDILKFGFIQLKEMGHYYEIVIAFAGMKQTMPIYQEKLIFVEQCRYQKLFYIALLRWLH